VPPSGQTVIEIIGKIWVRSAKNLPYVEFVSYATIDCFHRGISSEGGNIFRRRPRIASVFSTKEQSCLDIQPSLPMRVNFRGANFARYLLWWQNINYIRVIEIVAFE
jgi:hypothetical protein